MKDSIIRKEITFPNGIPQCGVDALRLTLCSSDVHEHYIKFNALYCEKSHRFLNKIWNATKFTLINCTTNSVNAITNPVISRNNLSVMDHWILSRLANTLTATTDSLDNLNIGCADLWRIFFYENLCDVYIEASKCGFQHIQSTQSQIQCEVLKTCLTIGLRHLGVFTPFLSNELLKYLPNQMVFEV